MFLVKLNLFVMRHMQCLAQKPILVSTITIGNFTQQFCNKANENVSEIAEVLSQALSCNASDARKLLKYSPLLRAYEPAKLTERIVFLQKHGILNSSLIKHPFLLREPENELQQKFGILHSLQIEDIDNYVALLRVNVRDFQKIKDVWLDDMCCYKKNRMVYLSEELNIDVKLVCEQFSKKLTYLFRKPLRSIIETLEILRSHNFDSEGILDNLQVFLHPIEAILDRMNDMKSMNISPRLWLVYCSQTDFDTYIANDLAEREAQGVHTDRLSFFKDKLGLDDVKVRDMFERNPRLNRCKLRRVTKIIDYLLNVKSYTQQDILNVPNILNFSIETIQIRLTYFERIGETGIPLSRLISISSAKVFEELGKDTILDEHERKP